MNSTLKAPADILPGTFFISGPVKNSSGIENEAFAQVEQALKELGHLVFNPENNLACKDRKARLSYMLMCDHVITLDDWWLCEASANEVKIARIAGMPVTLASTLIIKEYRHAG